MSRVLLEQALVALVEENPLAWTSLIKAIRAELENSLSKQAQLSTPYEQLQQKCSDWNAYWRASDAHGVILSQDQAHELLRDALGVEVEISLPTDEMPGTAKGNEMDDPNMNAYGDHYQDDSEVPGAHPPTGHPLNRLAARLGELLDEDHWAPLPTFAKSD